MRPDEENRQNQGEILVLHESEAALSVTNLEHTCKMSLESVMLQSALLSVFLFLIISLLLKLKRAFQQEVVCSNPGVR